MEREEAVNKLNTLIGEDLHVLASQYNITIHKNGKINKGWPGLTLERLLGLEQNSRREPDFGTWELKSVPLKYLKNGNLAVKETMAIAMIREEDVCENVQQKLNNLDLLNDGDLTAKQLEFPGFGGDIK